MEKTLEYIEKLTRRSLQLHGLALGEDGKFVDADKAHKDYLKGLCTALKEPNSEQSVIDLIESARGGDKVSQKALEALRVEQVSNFIFAESSLGAAYFETVTLKPNEEPEIINDTEMEILATFLGEDGTADEVRVVRSESKTSIGLRNLVSKKVRYKVDDLYRGRVADIAQKTFDIGRDLAFKFDRELFTMLNLPLAEGGCFGPFSYENDEERPETRVYLPHSGIVTDHLPMTNDWDLTQTPGAEITQQDIDDVLVNPLSVQITKFSLPVLMAVQHYANLWGKVLPGGGVLSPSGVIIVPSSDIIAIAEAAAPESGKDENQVQEQINRDGYMSLHYLGRNWKFVPDVTIESGVCFPQFNLLPGKVFRKPKYDKVFTDSNEEENWERRWQRMVFGAFITSQHRPRALRVRYKAA